MSPGEPPQPVDVVLLALPESAPAALYGLYEVFSSVGTVWSEVTGEPDSGQRMAVRIVSPDGRPLSSALGTPIAPHAGFAGVTRSDVVVVGELALPADADPRLCWRGAADWLCRQYAAGATVCSACTGSVLLAAAGLLDGEEATTHWVATETFRRHFPAVRLRPDRILCPAGPAQRLVTSGGAAAWEDLALYVIARYCGDAEAVRTAKLFLFGDRSEGQLPYAAMARPRRHEDAAIARCQAWIAEHYAGDKPVAGMVAHSGLAERTFKRRFRAATGYSPVAYVQALRIEEAKYLLETTADPTDVVAARVGYQDPAFFRRLFKRLTAVTPARYRQRFQAVGRIPQPAGTRAPG